MTLKISFLTRLRTFKRNVKNSVGNERLCNNLCEPQFFRKMKKKKNWEDCENVYFYKEKKLYFSSHDVTHRVCMIGELRSGTRENSFRSFDDLENKKSFHSICHSKAKLWRSNFYSNLIIVAMKLDHCHVKWFIKVNLGWLNGIQI